MSTLPVPSPAPNVDPAERAKFDAHAADWWNPQGALHTLHAVNPLRVDYIARQVPLAGARVADVGCGGGILSEALARAGAAVTGIDLSPAALAAARSHGAGEGLDIHYREVPVETLALEAPGSFDAVVCMELLEHVPDPQSAVRACATLLAAGGTAVFATLSRTPKAFAQAIVAAEYLLRILPRGTHRYTRFIRPSELARMCRAAGLTVTDLTGLTYHPLTRQYRLIAGVDVNYFLTATRPAA